MPDSPRQSQDAGQLCVRHCLWAWTRSLPWSLGELRNLCSHSAMQGWPPAPVTRTEMQQQEEHPCAHSPSAALAELRRRPTLSRHWTHDL